MMKWLLVAVIVTATVLSDLLQSREMKRRGEVRDFRPGPMGRMLASLAKRRLLILSILFMAISFFAFARLLSIADLSFAVPATAATYVVETLLAKLVLKEQVTLLRWTGAGVIACGVVLLAW